MAHQNAETLELLGIESALANQAGATGQPDRWFGKPKVICQRWCVHIKIH
jgi:hypothetical protein